jgi:hypothetical protein
MSEVLKTLDQMSLWDLPSAISSQELESGATHCVSPDGQTTNKSGQDHALASLSHQQAKERGLMIRAISGRRGFISSRSADLASSLVSRLQKRTDLLGSTMYSMTWKVNTTPQRRLIYALVASVRHISASEYFSSLKGWATPAARDYRFANSKPFRERGGGQKGEQLNNQAVHLAGWGTPVANPSNGEPEAFQERKRNAQARGIQMGDSITDIQMQAKLAGWPTPMAGTPAQNGNSAAGNNDSSRKTVALLSGWPTARATDGDKGPRTIAGVEAEITRKGSAQDLNQAAMVVGPVRLTASGTLMTGSDAEMESGGQLNPEHSRWLMGLPREFCDCAVTATELMRKSRKNS